MKAGKVIGSTLLIISILYLIFFIIMVYAVQTNPNDRPFPYIVCYLDAEYGHAIAMFPAYILLLYFLLIKTRNKILAYYITLFVSIINFILGAFFMYLWNTAI